MTGFELKTLQTSRRSRAGCDECRRRHWKCNEARPACACCQRINFPCVYSRRISWGGRPFKKSRFGKCLAQEAIAVSSIVVESDSPSAKDFVYTFKRARANHETSSTADITSPQSTQSQASPSTQARPLHDDTITIALPEHVESTSFLRSPTGFPASDPLSLVPTIPPVHKSLLDYFVNKMTMSISCHKGVQDEICSAVLPMAFYVRPLLYAVLALAAVHQQSASNASAVGLSEAMKGQSLKELRIALNQINPAESDQVLATILILCLAEVISPVPSTSSWKSHLRGAAMLSTQLRICTGSSVSSTSSFLARQYQALQAVALACGSTTENGQLLAQDVSDEYHIDDLAGYSTNLLPIFEQINDLGRLPTDTETDSVCDSPPGPPHFDCNTPLEHQSHLLFERISASMRERKLIRAQEHGTLDHNIRQDLHRLDDAYHHMAILQVFRLGVLSVPIQLIEDSKQLILTNLAAMEYRPSPSPAVASLPPLFVAGMLCTTSPDRQKVRKLLKLMWVNYGMGNVMSCRNVLEQWWKDQDSLQNGLKHSDLSGPVVDVCLPNLRRTMSKAEELDVLPY